MTTIVQPDQLWSSMPGWGIVVDLTPPELTAARQLKLLRKAMFSGLIVLVVLCLAGYGFALLKQSSASSALSAEQSRTSELDVQANKYGGITKIHSTVTGVQGTVSKLMVGDVDYATLLSNLRAALPNTMTIKTETVNFSAAATSASAATGGSGNGLNTTGHQRIGTVTLAGSARAFTDVSAYVDKLTAITGVVSIVPTSSQADRSGVQYSMTFGLTDQVLSHRFDNQSSGDK